MLSFPIHIQSSVAEIEDYREQTKRLLQDLTLKDEEIGSLKKSLYQSSPQGSDVSMGVHISVFDKESLSMGAWEIL